MCAGSPPAALCGGVSCVLQLRNLPNATASALRAGARRRRPTGRFDCRSLNADGYRPQTAGRRLVRRARSPPAPRHRSAGVCRDAVWVSRRVDLDRADCASHRSRQRDGYFRSRGVGKSFRHGAPRAPRDLVKHLFDDPGLRSGAGSNSGWVPDCYRPIRCGVCCRRCDRSRRPVYRRCG